MKHKAGETVLIRPEEWFNSPESKRCRGGSDTIMVAQMLEYAGKTSKILSVCADFYRLDIDQGFYRWADWMFDPSFEGTGPLPAADAIRAMLGGETLCGKDGDMQFSWDGYRFRAVNVYGTKFIDAFNDSTFYRRPAKQKRYMTHFEALGWASGAESRGWVVRPAAGGEWVVPQGLRYTGDIKDYQRARLLPDCSGVDESTVQGFEAEAEE
ncbi:MAG: hypothetical protein LBF77_06140 [Spirochaetaceae bacterium]|jgi:hypothetical protein|nr:hypothetical protein [Spirochaetaceae bacterium]